VQEIYWVFYFSQIFTDEQKPFSEQGEHAERWWPLPLPQLRPAGHATSTRAARRPRYPYKKDEGFVLFLISIYDS